MKSMTRRAGRSPRRLAVLASGAATVLLLSACAGGEADGGAADSVTVKVATMYGPENWQTQAMETYTDAVVEASGGQVNFEYFYGDSLVGADEMAGGLRDGVIDMATFVPSYTPASFPSDEWASSLAYMADPSPVAGYLQGVGATLEWGFEDEAYYSELENQGLQPLVPRFLVHHKYGILCTDENSTLVELENKRTRVGSTAATQESEVLNMVPTSVTGAETYSAFQQGILDCTWTNVPDMTALGLTDHATYYNTAGLMGFSSMALAMGEGVWDSLSAEAQEAIWSQVPVYLEAMILGNMEVNIDALSNEAMTWTTPDAQVAALIEEYHASLPAMLVENAPASVGDPAASIEMLEAAHAAWLTEVEALGYSADVVDWTEQVEEHGTEVPDISPWVDLITVEVFDEYSPTQ